MRIGVTGHQVIPTEGLDFIREETRSLLGSHSALMGVTSLAAGADQEFAQIVTDLGGGLVVVVPCLGYEETFTAPTDARRFQQLLSSAVEVVEMGFQQPSEQAFLAAGQRVVDESERLIAIWDGGESRGLGGTGDIVAYAEAEGVPVTVIWPAGLTR